MAGWPRREERWDGACVALGRDASAVVVGGLLAPMSSFAGCHHLLGREQGFVLGPWRWLSVAAEHKHPHEGREGKRGRIRQKRSGAGKGEGLALLRGLVYDLNVGSTVCAFQLCR